jgi:hypothetical protein
MPEKWSLPGGEYRRIIVKDHLKIKKGQEWKWRIEFMENRWWLRRTIIYPDRFGSQCIILFGGRVEASFLLSTTFIIQHHPTQVFFINLILQMGTHNFLDYLMNKSFKFETNLKALRALSTYVKSSRFINVCYNSISTSCGFYNAGWKSYFPIFFLWDKMKCKGRYLFLIFWYESVLGMMSMQKFSSSPESVNQ